MIALVAALSAFAEADPLPDGVQLPIKVSAAILVDHLVGVDESGSFDATADVILRWTDPSLAFDPAVMGTDRQTFTQEEADARIAAVWDPGIEIRNLEGEPQDREVSLRIYADGRVEYTRRLRGTFGTDIDLGRFPFDTQRLAIDLTSPAYSARQVVLVHEQEDAERSGLGPAMTLPEWKTRGLTFESSEFRGLDGTVHSEIVSRVRITRLASAYVASLFAPLAVILLLPVLCIWVRTDIHERINWVVTAVFSLIALNFSVGIEYPALGIDSVFMSLFWYGYVAQGVALGLIMVLFNEGFFAELFGEDLIEEILGYLSWALPTIIALAFGDVMLALAT